MWSAYFVLILLNIHNAVGNNAYHKHSGSIIYEQYSARDTESEKIVTLNLKNKFEENFENALENRIFKKIQAKLVTKVQNKIDELLSCCLASQNDTELQLAPQVVKVGDEITEMENTKVTMRCTFSGKPTPKITWSFGGTKIDSDFDRYRLMPDGALEITFLYRNDTGVYTCIAQNAAGTAQSAVTLTVNWNNDWCATTSATVASMEGTAVVVGLGVCGYHDLWVIRAQHGTGLIPGKYDVHTKVASFPMDGIEQTTTEFEIFCSPDRPKWVENTNGIPEKAIIGGFTALGPSGDALYIGRAVTGLYKTSGMVWNNVLYVPLNGMVYQHTSFEVLCRA